MKPEIEHNADARIAFEPLVRLLSLFRRRRYFLLAVQMDSVIGNVAIDVGPGEWMARRKSQASRVSIIGCWKISKTEFLMLSSA